MDELTDLRVCIANAETQMQHCETNPTFSAPRNYWRNILQRLHEQEQLARLRLHNEPHNTPDM